MDMKDHGVSEHVDPLMEDIDRYGLYKHVVELEAYGITVVPPETMRVDEEFVGRLRNAILRACERRNGVEITDYQTSVLAREDAGRNSWDLLEKMRSLSTPQSTQSTWHWYAGCWAVVQSFPVRRGSSKAKVTPVSIFTVMPTVSHPVAGILLIPVMPRGFAATMKMQQMVPQCLYPVVITMRERHCLMKRIWLQRRLRLCR